VVDVFPFPGILPTLSGLGTVPVGRPGTGAGTGTGALGIATGSPLCNKLCTGYGTPDGIGPSPRTRGQVKSKLIKINCRYTTTATDTCERISMLAEEYSNKSNRTPEFNNLLFYVFIGCHKQLTVSEVSLKLLTVYTAPFYVSKLGTYC